MKQDTNIQPKPQIIKIHYGTPAQIRSEFKFQNSQDYIPDFKASILQTQKSLNPS